MTLERLTLARSTVDRAAERRTDADLVAHLLADAQTAVLVLDAGLTPVIETDGAARLALCSPSEAARLVEQAAGPGHLPERLAAFLGVGDQPGRGYVVHALMAPPPPGPGVPPPPPPADPNDPTRPPLPDGAHWAGLRDVAPLLDDTDAGLLTAAVALANWHAGHPRCARCGEPTTVITAGWARSCPACGAEHYPRTDPAVIMTVVDGEDRILLGRQARWPQKRFSTLAGFVEPGESLEAAVRREVFEEAGVVVGEVEYRGSQPWPFPSSLMLGFTAHAVTTQEVVDGVELAQARWWTREQFAKDLADGDLLLPGPVSIARRLIEDWYGEEITDAASTWR